MGEVSTKVIKVVKAAKVAKAAKPTKAPKVEEKVSQRAKRKPIPAPPPTMALTVPRDRKIPRPLHSPAKTTMRIVLEHVYWLGDAIRSGDKERAQREVDGLAKWACHYRTFAGNPAAQKIKYSSDVENYPNNVKKKQAVAASDDDESDLPIDDIDE